ncbi:Oxidation resistance protein 1 [Thelohanellus kitauei]|uniref:Oxidation resistance protein 1 n=1 Tax=Thelohanellus kitauei TaxID=669202 RepID=A0A0C2IW64_THEKT|nr:Oxidation resistance protein 1 [Thelohanellus kitauei]
MSSHFTTKILTHPAKLGYSNDKHGTSMRTMYRNMTKFNDSPCILVVQDDQHQIFGAILSELPKVSNAYYGDGYCSLFKKIDEKDVKFYTWTQKNRYFITGDNEYFAIGSGG